MKAKKLLQKTICTAAAAVPAASVLACPAMADGGSGAGRVPASSMILYSDIASYINHYPIPSYAYNGKMVVVAEDLRNYGFNVTWDEGWRSLYIEPNYETNQIAGMGAVYSNRDKHGQTFAYIMPSDIKTYLNGVEIPSVNINGYTMVPVEDLANAGIGTEYTYDDSTRSLKLWENWTGITEYQPLPSAPGSANTGQTGGSTVDYNLSSHAGVYQKGDICISVVFDSDLNCYVRQVSYPYRGSYNMATADTIYDFQTAKKIPDNVYYINSSILQCELTLGNGTITLSGTDERYSQYYGEYEQVSNMGPNMDQSTIWIK